MRTVHVVVPDGIDDPARPSGGNVYDRQACRALAATGWTVHEHAVPGGWPVIRYDEERDREIASRIIAALVAVLVMATIAAVLHNE